jgi:malonyl-CoA O-methyltransferase
MRMGKNESVAARFSASAATYDDAASVQKTVANRVARLVTDLPAARLVLEIGCGTGLLTERLLEILPAAQIHALDISCGMIEKARARILNEERVNWITADARRFAAKAEYDLVASSSSLHWILPIEDAFRAVSPTLKDGGYLVFGLMLAGTLAELHASRRRVVPHKPAEAALPTGDNVLAALRQKHFHILRQERDFLTVHYPSAECFLRAIHEQGVTGGDVSRGSRHLHRGELRRLTADYAAHYRDGEEGVFATYDVLYAVARKREAS